MKLYLEDGSCFEGVSAGAERSVAGEVVFTTGMAGYPEALTDPSYKGQIVVFSYPLIGNYGLKGEMQSSGIKASGVIAHRITSSELKDWLIRENVPAIEGIDTRDLVKRIREKGVMRGSIGARTYESFDYEGFNAVDDVSTKSPEIIGEGSRNVLLVDLGVKNAIIKELLSRGLRLIRVSWDCDLREAFEEHSCEAVVISNGPGNPVLLKKTVAEIKRLPDETPALGICLGAQMLAIAEGAEIYKMRYGHRGTNKPVRDVLDGRCYITSQNHGYAIDESTLCSKVWMKSLDDDSVEAFKGKSSIGVQFHPEGSPGPLDTEWIFDSFLREVLYA
jgi:carbamoyl-phosphate synthase small subunit